MGYDNIVTKRQIFARCSFKSMFLGQNLDLPLCLSFLMKLFLFRILSFSPSLYRFITLHLNLSFIFHLPVLSRLSLGYI